MTTTLHSQIPFMGEIGVLAPRKEAEAYAGYDPSLSAKQIDIYNYGGLFRVSQELKSAGRAVPPYLSMIRRG